MKFFNTARITVLSVLSLVIAVLMTVIIANEFIIDEAAGSQPETHQLVRDARVGLASKVEWENNFGGSGDEYPVSVYTANGKLYIFGNTTSNDLDFSGGGVFASRLSEFGRTEKFVTFGIAGDELFSASLTEYGFMLAFGGEEQTMTFIDFELNTSDSTVLAKTEENTAYKICDVGFFENKYYIFRQAKNSSVSFVVCDILTTDGKVSSPKIFKQSLNLTYRGFFPGKTHITAFEEIGSSAGCATFAEWTVTGIIAYKRVTTSIKQSTLDIYPILNGWAVLSSGNGETFISVIGKDYSPIRKVYIDFPIPASGKLFHSYETNSLFAAVFIEGEISALFNLGTDVIDVIKTTVPSFSSMQLYSAAGGDVLTVCGAGKVNVAVITAKGITVTEITDGASSPMMARNGDNWYITFAAQKTSAIIGGNYGGYDIAVAKLKF